MSPSIQEPEEPIRLSRISKATSGVVEISMKVEFDHWRARRALDEFDDLCKSLRDAIAAEADIWDARA